MFNNVVLIGRITKEVELKKIGNDNISCVQFSLAVDRGFKDASGNKTTDFIPCVAWKSQADFLKQYVKKGYLLGVRGSLQQRTYQDQFGNNKTIYEVHADRVFIASSPKEDENQASQQAPQTSVQQQVEDDDLPF